MALPGLGTVCGPAPELLPGVSASPAACPACDMAPGYRVRPADPWDVHECCTGCGFCYLHDDAANHRLSLELARAAELEREAARVERVRLAWLARDAAVHGVDA